MRRMRTAVVLTAVATIAIAAIAISASSATAPKAAAATAPPTVTTGAATTTGPTSETVTGIVNPNGQATHYYFQFGTTTAYGSQTNHVSAGAGTTNVAVSATLSGLTAGSTYHYRLVAHSVSGTSVGVDQTFQAPTGPLTTSQVRVMGREGFVSPGGIIGVELGCFVGQTTCTGHIAMTHNGTLVGQRDFSIPPESGGFHNLRLTPQGQQLLTQNHRFHLLGVDVTVTTGNGATLNYVIHLAHWIWF